MLSSNTLSSKIAEEIGAVILKKVGAKCETSEEHRQIHAAIKYYRALKLIKELENCIYERYLTRMNLSKDARSMSQMVPLFTGKNQLSRSKDYLKKDDRTVRLTAEEKCIVFHSEMEEYRKDIERLRSWGDTEISNYTVALTSLNADYDELMRTRAIFDKIVTLKVNNSELLVGPMKPRGTIEKFHHIYNNRMDTNIQNLIVETNTLKQHKKRLCKHIRELEEGEHTVDRLDLRYLQIQCEQAISQLQHLYNQRVNTKARFAKVNQLLLKSKLQLKQELQYGKKLQEQNKFMGSLITRLKNDQDLHKDLAEKEEKANEDLQNAIATHRVPNTMEYIQHVQDLTRLTRQRLRHERKRSLAELALKNHRKLWHQMRKSCIQ